MAAVGVAVLVVGKSTADVHPGAGQPGAGPEPQSTSAAAGPPAASFVASGTIPRYYVATAANGNPNFHPSYAVVRATATGATLGTISPPPGGTFLAVTAAADDRTFVLDEESWLSSGNGAFQPRSFYLLRLGADGRPGVPTKLSISTPAGALVTGVALSPDGGKLALATQPHNVPNKPDLTEVKVYTLATGRVRTWQQDGGVVGSGPDDAASLSWTSDQKTLAFEWEAVNPQIDGLWLLDLGKPGTGLLANSHQGTSWGLSPLGKPVNPLTSPSAARSGATPAGPSPSSAATSVYGSGASGLRACQGESIITPDGSTVVCGAIRQLDNTTNQFHFLEFSAATGKGLRVLGNWTFRNATDLTINVLWSNPSGSVLIGVIPTGKGSKVGVIHGDEFSPLPASTPAYAVW